MLGHFYISDFGGGLGDATVIPIGGLGENLQVFILVKKRPNPKAYRYK
ncbi:MAG: hypothetical protein ACFB02_11655 [Mastigocoleus sp.]